MVIKMCINYTGQIQSFMSQAIQRQHTKTFLHIVTLKNRIKETNPSPTCAVQYLYPAYRYNFVFRPVNIRCH